MLASRFEKGNFWYWRACWFWKKRTCASLFGAMQPDSGEIWLRGKKLTIRSPEEAIRNGIALISEDRKRLAMLIGRSIVENTALIHNEFFRGSTLSRREEQILTSSIMKRLSVAMQSELQTIEELSGGNQQKVIIGRWLLDEGNFVLYIFDEPTKGVDIGAKENIYELMVKLAEKGKSIIMISSSMPELISMSDRIGIMRHGRMIDIVESRTVTEEDLIKRFIGV